MCSCKKKSTPAGGMQYVVTFPSGSTAVKTSEVAAKLAAGRVPGATWKAQPAATSA